MLSPMPQGSVSSTFDVRWPCGLVGRRTPRCQSTPTTLGSRADGRVSVRFSPTTGVTYLEPAMLRPAGRDQKLVAGDTAHDLETRAWAGATVDGQAGYPESRGGTAP